MRAAPERCRRSICGLVVLALPCGCAARRAAKEAKLSAEEKAAIEKITTYFNNFRYLNGEFVQRGPSGHFSQGMFYMSKPGRLRFEYAAPNPFLVVADGTYVIIKDRRMKRADHYPLSATPLQAGSVGKHRSSGRSKDHSLLSGPLGHFLDP